MSRSEIASLLERLLFLERMRAGRGTAAYLLRLELRAKAMMGGRP